MKSNRKTTSAALSLVIILIKAALPSPVLAGSNGPFPQHWSVQVDKVQPGDVNIEPAFSIAIYENLLHELSKTKQLKKFCGAASAGPTTLRTF